MKINSLRFGIGISMLMAIVFGSISPEAKADKPVSMPCYASSTPSPGWVHIDCLSCTTKIGFGEIMGTCNPN